MNTNSTTERGNPSLYRLLRGAMHLSGGTAIGHAITLLATPFIAKFYGPEAFGVWAGWAALAGVTATFACFRYETAISLPEEDREALHLAGVAIFVAAVVSIVVGLLVVAAWLAEVPGPWQRLGGHVLWLPFGMLVIAWVSVATQWLARRHEVAALARAKVWASGVTAGIQLGFGFAGGASGLILGDLIGRSAGLWRQLKATLRAQAVQIAGIKLGHLSAARRQYRSHAAWMTPTALIDALGQQAPMLLMLHWHGAAIGGQFSLAQRLLALPVALLGQSVAQLFLPAMVTAYRNSAGAARHLFLGASGLLALASIGLIGLSGCVEESWLVAIFGSGWSGMTHFLLPLSLLAGIQLTVSTLSQTAVVLGGQKWYALWVVLWAGATVAGMLLGQDSAGANGAIWGLVVGSGLPYFFLWAALLARLSYLNAAA